MRAARHGSAWLIGCRLNLTKTLIGGLAGSAAKKTLASPRPPPKNRGEAGVLPGARDCPRVLGRLRTDPLNLAGPVPVKGVRHH